MFVLGLLVGPFLGLLLIVYVLRPAGFSVFLSALVVALCVVAVLFAGILPLELKLGFLTGFGLGILLATTPMSDRTTAD